ncbi:MAG TPA: pyridoxal-phosphate dependent enzyme [Gemmatimonadaceae bacterium]|nr:pyridoxal-phosphate dependent enzyme [Gemmatimonadaceae bacterium]
MELAASPEAIESARGRLRGIAVRTPLVPLEIPGRTRPIWLKLETLQPVGSFKIRGAGSAITAAPRDRLAHGVYTASAGNMAQGVAWCARAVGVPCTVIVPEHAPAAKISAVERLGATVVRVPLARWWQVMVERSYPGMDGLFVHPVSDPDVIAGNATIAAEILEDAPETDTVLIPFGGGGLSCGAALGLRARGSKARVFACEVETAAPLAASLRAGKPSTVERTPSFVDGIGIGSLLEEMWPLASTLLGGSLVSSIDEVAGAVRFMAERAHVIAEGAGAAAVAAAMAGKAPGDNVVCVVSGGSIDLSKLVTILQGGVPS